ncbi:putative PHD finger protein [Monocercomonoides exilis]|uniref:putative PHD finger protein n=1 Tax=Monocercomonoides exilis TaxID=2049356 RepID=UPI00355A65BB|nr:putative PHD finger protein [Monocercomonoides exilis]|eukprot:MONOS_13362.1-p1 / transcript=MONOS_13362.1 / gene=MONOS_13362 / organism=Monocercomonoides_exilis_PA203 / gene_product=AGAP006776-PA / transcript_product=AGAP006776-PA / location=Mono_scaffold00816:17653-20433(+) / protein_length=653 / sequence_SO=supercontig / SO=protein_coding / is_pseudo=false
MSAKPKRKGLPPMTTTTLQNPIKTDPEEEEPPYKFKPCDILDDEIPEEERTCSVCGQMEASQEDLIVYCDGCQTAVHQYCYGITDEEVGQETWLCRPCSKGIKSRTPDGKPNQKLRCKLCGHLGGAMSELAGGAGWIHASCAIHIPEITFEEGCANIENIKKYRFKESCCICYNPTGATVRCSVDGCKNNFHVHCAARNALCFETIPNPSLSRDTLTVQYCHVHTPTYEPLTADEKCLYYEQLTPRICHVSNKEKHAGAQTIEDIIGLKETCVKAGKKSTPLPYKDFENCFDTLAAVLRPKAALAPKIASALSSSSSASSSSSSSLSSSSISGSRGGSASRDEYLRGEALEEELASTLAGESGLDEQDDYDEDEDDESGGRHPRRKDTMTMLAGEVKEKRRRRKSKMYDSYGDESDSEFKAGDEDDDDDEDFSDDGYSASELEVRGVRGSRRGGKVGRWSEGMHQRKKEEPAALSSMPQMYHNYFPPLSSRLPVASASGQPAASIGSTITAPGGSVGSNGVAPPAGSAAPVASSSLASPPAPAPMPGMGTAGMEQQQGMTGVMYQGTYYPMTSVSMYRPSASPSATVAAALQMAAQMGSRTLYSSQPEYQQTMSQEQMMQYQLQQQQQQQQQQYYQQTAAAQGASYRQSQQST